MRIRIKKLIAITLAFTLTLALLPVFSVPASAAETLTNALTFTASTNSVDNIASYGYKWDKDTLTLTLDGMNLVTSAATALTLPAGSTIMLADGSVNTVTSTYNGASGTFGISAAGALKIMGDTGILNVASGNSTGNSSCGILAGGEIAMTGGTLNTTGGTASAISYGLSINTSSPLIMTGGTLSATGGSGGTSSYGLNGIIYAYNGTLTAKGNTRGLDDTPTVGAGAAIAGSTYTDGTSSTDITAANAATNTYKYVQITATGGALPRTTQLNFNGTNISYKGAAGSTSGSVSSNILDSIEGWKWYKTPADGYAANTLVLDGLSLNVTTSFPLIVPADTAIIVLGDSTVTSGSTSDVDTYAIDSKGNLIIDVAQYVTLSVAGGTVSGAGSSCGIRSTGNIVKKRRRYI